MNRGFTVLETIIAIAVVGVAIGGTTSVVRTGLLASTTAKEQVKAFYLAQEAVELIRNKRDGNLLNTIANGSTNSWLTGIAAISSDPCAVGFTCYADAYTNTLTRCGGGFGTCPLLRQNGSLGQDAYLYGYNGSWATTNYRREIQIESSVGNSEEIWITVRVSWTHGAVTREFKTKTLLTNWL